MLIIAIGVSQVWFRCIKPAYLAQVSVFGDMIFLEGAVALFNTRNDRLPTNLREIVDAGILPSESELYFCPLTRGTFFKKILPYEECDYQFIYMTNRVIIKIPDDAFASSYVTKVPEEMRILEVSDTTTIYGED